VIVSGRAAAAGAAAGVGARSVRLDLASQRSIEAAVERLRAEGLLPLGALVANAGTQITKPARTADGFEATFGVNHLGHVALVARLLACAGIARGGRIVLVTSGTHDPSLRTGMPKPRPVDARALSAPAPADEDATESRRRYTTSKLANVMTAYELARRLAPAGIAVNAFDPGLMPGTGLARDASPAARLVWRTAMRALVLLPGVSSPARSSRTLAALAADSRFEGVTGRYWSIDRERRSSEASYDTAAQRALWRDSLAVLGIADPAPAPSA
jgi:NAD(P)-dependent dehydrogenase (short-subunit alcohol dehydrogenase family)